jgi:competence protein ComEC
MDQQRRIIDAPIRTARYQPLVIVLAAAAAGIALDRFCPLNLTVWFGLAAAFWIVWAVLWRRHRNMLSAAALMISAAALAASWHHCRWQLFSQDDLGHFALRQPQPICIEAAALKMPRTSQTTGAASFSSQVMTKLEIAPLRVRDGRLWRPVSGRARLNVPDDLPGVMPGDRLRIFAQLSATDPARNPGEFDSADFLRGQRVRGELMVKAVDCVTVVEPGSAWSLTRMLEQMRVRGNRVFATALDSRRADLANAVLLGLREEIDPERTEAFMETGTIHVLVIAGLHLGILAGALMFVMLRCPIPRVWAVAIVAAFTVCYALMVDAQPPVVRAAILVLVACSAICLGRSALGFNSLAAAALVVLIVNPADMFHTGAQLSFLCAAGIVWSSPWLGRRRRFHDPLQRLIAESRGGLNRAARSIGRAVLSMAKLSLVLWLMSMPLVMSRFHLFTPVAVLVNAVLWAPIAAALISGFATLVLGSFSGALGAVCGLACNGSFWIVETLVRASRSIPGSHFWLPGPPDWWLLGFYGGLAALAAFPRFRPRLKWCAALLAVWTTAGFGAAMLGRSPGRLDCTFLAMDHGCAVMMELPSGQTMLYDAGKLGSPNGAARSVSAALWSRGVTHIDAVVLSHGDSDHYNALPELIERFSIGAVYVSPVMFEYETPSLLALKQLIQQKNIPLREISAGDCLDGGKDCRIVVLHPPPRGVLDSENANSVVLSVEYLGHRILLPGDVEGRGINDLVAEEPTPCDVLMVPHHGSRQSNPPGLAQWSKPHWVVISGSKRFDPRPIQEAYEAVGAEVLQTTDLGALRARIEPSGMSVSPVMGATLASASAQ